MAEKNGKGMYVNGICNGVTSYQDKQGKYWHSVIIILPNQEQNLRITLDPSTNPTKFQNGSDVEMKVSPRMYQGRISGFVEVIG